MNGRSPTRGPGRRRSGRPRTAWRSRAAAEARRRAARSRSAVCRNCAKKNTAPNSDAVGRTPLRCPPRRSASGRSASAASARARAAPKPTNATVSSTPAASAADDLEAAPAGGVAAHEPPDHAQSGARRRARGPGCRGRCRGRRLSSIRASTSGITTRPIGTLSQKIHCQARPSTIAPPTNGPLATASPVTALKIPSARARRSGGNAALSSASAERHHQRRARALDGARGDQPADVGRERACRRRRREQPEARVNRRRRPKRSPSAAPVINSTAKLRL